MYIGNLKMFLQNENVLWSHVVSMPHINMQIFNYEDENNEYRDWLLEINSNKFWIKLSFEDNNINTFEIISAKWYYDMNLWFIKTIRNIVFNLYQKMKNERSQIINYNILV